MAARGVIRKHIRFFFFWYCAGQRFIQSTRLIDSNRDNGRIVWHGTGWVPCFLRNGVVCRTVPTLETLVTQTADLVTVSHRVWLWVSDWQTTGLHWATTLGVRLSVSLTLRSVVPGWNRIPHYARLRSLYGSAHRVIVSTNYLIAGRGLIFQYFSNRWWCS